MNQWIEQSVGNELNKLGHEFSPRFFYLGDLEIKTPIRDRFQEILFWLSWGPNEFQGASVT